MAVGGRGLALLAACCPFVAGCPTPSDTGPEVDPWYGTIDVHSHVKNLAGTGEEDNLEIVDAALEAIDEEALQLLILLPPPGSPGMDDPPAPVESLMELVEEHGELFRFLGGGATLNTMIQRAVTEGDTSPELREAFEARAHELAELGVLGFGELAAVHLSLGDGHDFQAAPADHELFLALADIAAAYGLSLDIHMEAAPEDTELSGLYSSVDNPEWLDENISGLERLLAHNRDARIIWTHAGWDNTGQRTAALTEQLLEAHDNLYLSIKIADDCPQAWSMVDGKGFLRDDWLRLISDRPHRFMMGTDHFFVPAGWPEFFEANRVPADPLLEQLPEDAAELVGHETAVELFGL